MTSKAKVLVVHGLAQKPAAPLLKAHVNYCLDCLRPDQITLLYWADLAGYPPRTWNSPADYRVSGKFDHLRRKVFGFTRQIARKGVEHSIAIALGLDPITCCGSTCFVPSTWIAAPVEKEARTLFGTQLREMANYFSAGSELRQGILQRVFTLDSNVFPARFDVAIGHSMGSVILADMLRTGAIMPVTHLVTIGSPLGLGVVRYALDEYYPAAFPLSQCYSGEWLNVSDPLDIVALDATLDGEYPGCKVNDVQIENDALTPEGKRHYHSLYGYLRSKPVQDLVRRSL